MSTALRPLADVIIADKSPLVRAALKALFAEDGRFNLVAMAADGDRFLEAVEKFSCDLGVIGWVMPYKDGRAVLEALRAMPDAPRMVVYTGIPDKGVSRQVMRLGGAAFVSKEETTEKLLDTLADVASGRMVFPFMDMGMAGENPLGALTAREHDLLSALSEGKSNAQLAAQFGISVNTVKFHLKNIFDKLDVANRSQAVVTFLSASP